MAKGILAIIQGRINEKQKLKIQNNTNIIDSKDRPKENDLKGVNRASHSIVPTNAS